MGVGPRQGGESALPQRELRALKRSPGPEGGLGVRIWVKAEHSLAGRGPERRLGLCGWKRH